MKIEKKFKQTYYTVNYDLNYFSNTIITFNFNIMINSSESKTVVYPIFKICFNKKNYDFL